MPLFFWQVSGAAQRAQYQALQKSKVHAFPVVGAGNSAKGGYGSLFLGTASRRDLLALLETPQISDYETLREVAEKFEGRDGLELEKRLLSSEDARAVKSGDVIDLRDIYDRSALSLPENFPIDRAYIIFRAMGLRHLTVVDQHNHPVGIITRKELIGMHIEHATANGHGHGEDPRR